MGLTSAYPARLPLRAFLARCSRSGWNSTEPIAASSSTACAGCLATRNNTVRISDPTVLRTIDQSMVQNGRFAISTNSE